MKLSTAAATLSTLALALAHCGTSATKNDAGSDAPVVGDTPVVSDSPVVGDGGDAGAAPIAVAFDCARGTNTTGPGPATPDSMQRAAIDTTAFPDAICNDGTGAAIYFRPYRGEANRNRWLINLRGGGSCIDGQSCASRWCGCANGTLCPGAPESSYTNFDRDNMSSIGLSSQGGTGIFLRGDSARPNVLGDYNHVRVVYCSSDEWAGSRRGATLTALHPRTGAPTSYTIHFLGARILDAVLSTLRHDGADAPTFTLDGTRTAMPDLDDATEVVFAGDSGGGAGVINNLDRVAETLRSHNTACASGSACPLAVRGLIDATIGPELSRLTPSPMGRIGGAGLRTYSDWIAYTANLRTTNIGARVDESCVAWHRANRPGTESSCYDEEHVFRHHVTTPFFVRQALRDVLLVTLYNEMGWTDPTLGDFDRAGTVFARALQPELAALPRLSTTAEEGRAITTAPGVFAPLCIEHDTINTTDQVFGVTITPSGGTALRLLDVFDAWRRGASPSVSVADLRDNITACP